MNRHSHPITRRTLLKGVGVTMALPWLESLSGWGADSPLRRAPRRVPQALRGPLHGQRHQPQELVRQGVGRRHGAEQEPRTPRPVPVPAERHLRPVQQARHRRRHPPRPDRQHPVGGRPAKGGRAARRRQRGSGARRPLRGGDRPAEPRAGLRAADHRLPRDELLDGLQLAHLLARRQLAGADGGLPVAGLRQSLRQPGQPPHAQHPRPRQGAGRGPRPPGQPRRPRQARRVPDQRARRGEARRAHLRRQGPGRRKGARPRPAPNHNEAPRRRAAGGHPRAHAAHGRHRRAGLPDRQDARRHAALVPRPVRPLLSVPRRVARPTTRPRTTTIPTLTSG